MLSGPKIKKITLISLSRTLKYAWANAVEMPGSLIKRLSVG
jgi:hypothetical protein